MINWTNKDDVQWEGTFTSRIFRNEEDDELTIFIENTSVAEFAEKCADSLNTLPQQMIDEICSKIAESAEEVGESELPALDEPQDILKYCWFTTVYVNAPKDGGAVSYIVEGEGDWGESVGFVIENDKLTYVGADYFNA